MESITGKWIGEYIYGDSYVEELKGKSVKFLLELLSEGELISGTCIDEETKELYPKPARIEGTFENGSILFYKTYPSDLEMVENKLRALEYNSASIQYMGVLKKKFFFENSLFRRHMGFQRFLY